MQDLVVEMVIAYLELGYPLPVDMYIRLTNEGIDVDSLIQKHTI
jgi:hypothetical protein